MKIPAIYGKTFKRANLWSLEKVVGNKAKGRISKRAFQEKKARQIFRKMNISHPLIRTRTYVSGSKKCSFFGKFGVLCFLKTPVLRLPLLPYHRRKKHLYCSQDLFCFRFTKIKDLQKPFSKRFAIIKFV